MKAEIRGLSGALALLAGLAPVLFYLWLPFGDQWLPGSIGWGTITLYDWQRMAMAAVLMLSVGVAATVADAKWVLPKGYFAGLCILLMIGGLSIAVSDANRWSAWIELINAGLLMLAFNSISSGLFRFAGLGWQRPVTLSLSGSALLYVVAFFSANYDSLFVPLYMGDGVLFPAFSNVRFFSDYQALLFPFLIHLIETERGARRYVFWLLAASFFLLFFYTGSRVVVLGQVGAHLSMFLLVGRRHLPVFARHLGAWAGGGLLFLALSYGIPFLASREALPSAALVRWDLSLRDVLWSAAWQDVLTHPLWGIGPGQFSRQINPVAAAPHNALLMIAAEWGIPALLLVLVGVASLARSFANRLRLIALHKDRRDSCPEHGFPTAAWLAFVALLLHSLVANVWVIPTSQLAMLLAGCLVYCCATAGRPLPSSVWLYRGGRALAALVCVGMAAILAHDIPRLTQRNSDYLKCMSPTPFFSPRFWQQGWDLDECPPLPRKQPIEQLER